MHALVRSRFAETALNPSPLPPSYVLRVRESRYGAPKETTRRGRRRSEKERGKCARAGTMQTGKERERWSGEKRRNRASAPSCVLAYVYGASALSRTHTQHTSWLLACVYTYDTVLFYHARAPRVHASPLLITDRRRFATRARALARSLTHSPVWHRMHAPR